MLFFGRVVIHLLVDSLRHALVLEPLRVVGDADLLVVGELDIVHQLFKLSDLLLQLVDALLRDFLVENGRPYFVLWGLLDRRLEHLHNLACQSVTSDGVLTWLFVARELR